MDSLHAALLRHPQAAPYLESTLERLLPPLLPSCPLTKANLAKHDGAPLPPTASWRDDDAATFARAKYYLTVLPIEAWRNCVCVERTPSEVSLMSDGEVYSLEGIDRGSSKSDTQGDTSDCYSYVAVAEEQDVPPSISPLLPPPSTPALAPMPATQTRHPTSAPPRLPCAQPRGIAPVGSCSSHAHLAPPAPHNPATRITRPRPSYPPTPLSLDSGLGRSLAVSHESHTYTAPVKLLAPQSHPLSHTPPLTYHQHHQPSLPIDAPDVLDIVYELQARADVAEQRARCFEVLLARTVTQLSRAWEEADTLKFEATSRNTTRKSAQKRPREGDNDKDREGRVKRPRTLSPTYTSPATKRAPSDVAAIGLSLPGVVRVLSGGGWRTLRGCFSPRLRDQVALHHCPAPLAPMGRN